jgi:hypothetical protein
MDAVDTVNGCEVIASVAALARGATRAGRVILVDRGPQGADRWVTAWQGKGDAGWMWGHYFVLETEAREDFAYRAKRGF